MLQLPAQKVYIFLVERLRPIHRMPRKNVRFRISTERQTPVPTQPEFPRVQSILAESIQSNDLLRCEVMSRDLLDTKALIRRLDLAQFPISILWRISSLNPVRLGKRRCTAPPRHHRN
jgi:hypothetical protein